MHKYFSFYYVALLVTVTLCPLEILLSVPLRPIALPYLLQCQMQLEMWANAQRDGRPVDYRWRPLFNAAVWLTPATRVPLSNAAKTRETR